MADAGGIVSDQRAPMASLWPVDTGPGCLRLVLALSEEAFEFERVRRDYFADGRLAGCGDPVRLARQTPASGIAGAPSSELPCPVTVTWLQDAIMVDGREQIRAGMRASAEIKTGDRRVIEYLFSPVMQAMKEARRER